MTFEQKVGFADWLNDVTPGELLPAVKRGLKPDAPEDVADAYEEFLVIQCQRQDRFIEGAAAALESFRQTRANREAARVA